MIGRTRWYLVKTKHGWEPVKGLARDNNESWLGALAAGTYEACEAAKRLLEMP